MTHDRPRGQGNCVKCRSAVAQASDGAALLRIFRAESLANAAERFASIDPVTSGLRIRYRARPNGEEQLASGARNRREKGVPDADKHQDAADVDAHMPCRIAQWHRFAGIKHGP